MDMPSPSSSPLINVTLLKSPKPCLFLSDTKSYNIQNKLFEQYIRQNNTRVAIYFHVQVNVTSCHSNFVVHRVMAEQIFNALKAIET